MNDIILASSSQRREEILKQFNFKFKIIKSHVKEIVNEKDSPENLAMSLAFRKAFDVAKDNPKSIVIAADTVVYYRGRILSKPKDSKEAYEMLSSLSGDSHEVITGICIINLEKNIKIIDYDKTLVRFRELDKEEIDAYIETREPFDKAGSYGIQGIGALLIEKVEGSYLNVVGLPIVKLDKILKEFFDIRIINMKK